VSARELPSKLSPAGTAENAPGHGPELPAPSHELSILETEYPGLHPGAFSAVPTGLLGGTCQPRTHVLGYSQPSLRDSGWQSAIGRCRGGRRGGTCQPRTHVLGYSQPSLRDSGWQSAIGRCRGGRRGGTRQPRTHVLGYFQPSLRGSDWQSAIGRCPCVRRRLSGPWYRPTPDQ
jgi:hypothetical protein